MKPIRLKCFGRSQSFPIGSIGPLTFNLATEGPHTAGPPLSNVTFVTGDPEVLAAVQLGTVLVLSLEQKASPRDASETVEPEVEVG